MNSLAIGVALGALTSLLTIAAELGILALVFIVVKPRRPDAFMPLVLWAGLSLMGTLFFLFLNRVGLPLVTHSYGVTEVAMFYSVQAWLRTILHLGLMALLGMGIVKLTRAPA
ncbi:MAG: hypothetical protein KBF88_06850 [Polyangiaceae bacterium]|nr:hypothetical protein [Polyangiaceae bacterium]